MSRQIEKYKLLEIENKIYSVRGVQVMLDSDLAEMYDVETKVLNQAVKRNLERFPEDFRFQLTNKEHENLRSQIVTLEGEDININKKNRARWPHFNK